MGNAIVYARCLHEQVDLTYEDVCVFYGFFELILLVFVCGPQRITSDLLAIS